MWWAALLSSDPARYSALSPTEGTQALALWALQFTPRVALVDEAVVMEVGASLRLFGGARRLAGRVRSEAAPLGVDRIAWAPNSLAALALARAGQPWSAGRLQTLPLASLSAARPHAAALARMGCRTLGALDQLPRPGVARRFGQALLDALDRLFGRAPESHVWITPPERFDARMELMHRVDAAPALLSGARRLLWQMAGWLAARHAGITACTLHWAHDAMRSRGAGEGGQLVLRTAEPTRDVDYLCRLLAEHLDHVQLAAPVGDLRLEAGDTVALPARPASWLPGEAGEGEPLSRALERIAARLGEERVRRPELREDHRPEWMCAWRHALPLDRAAAGVLAPSMHAMPQPGFLRPEPLRLAVRGNRPCYQGELQLLLGPQRLESGWWDGDHTAPAQRLALRDYWLALSEQAGLLWVFQTRLAAEPAWFLHGHFA